MKQALLSLLLPILIYITGLSQQINIANMNTYPTGTIIRISIGYFQPEQTDEVQAMLQTGFKQSLVPAIKKLKGNLGYYVAIDTAKHAMTNVSFWKTREDAMQMGTLKEMLDMRTTFERLGLKFIDITNHDILWKLPG
jgi:quinol monooxygenase YgiN